jgi:hypothetical protein
MNGDALKRRFEQVSRGRGVGVQVVQGSVLSLDYDVRFDEPTQRYVVNFTSGGLFEEAYRFVLRWIARHAQRLDGVFVAPPADHLDWRNEPMYWIIERCFDQYLSDLREAVQQYSAGLREQERSGRIPPTPGTVTVASRVHALQTLVGHFAPFQAEVHGAVLSPQTASLLQSLNLLPDGEEDARPTQESQADVPGK